MSRRCCNYFYWLLKSSVKMCQSPNSSVLRRTIDLKYASKKRASALRWLLFNGALLAVLAYDLWGWCSTCWELAWAEALAACALAASCAAHAARALAGAATPRGARLDSSCPAPRSAVEEPGSLCARRIWRCPPDSPPSPPSPHSPHSPHSPPGGSGGRISPDDFISDGRALAAYIRQEQARSDAGGALSACGAAGAGGRLLAAPPRPHQLATLPERGNKEPPEEEGGAAGAPLWRRLHVDPRRLTEYNLNLRLWLHVTVVSRVARELEAAGGPGGTGGTLHATLLPFVRPFADTQYVADRIKELSRGGCLSAYRWDGGGRGWSPPRPPDAELLLHLFVTYMDLLTGGAFSARHVAGGSGGSASAGSTLALRRARASPPHYVLQLGAETLDVGGGRDNLLHTLLLFVAAAARPPAGPRGPGGPPALCRLHLGPASLNMLWILGR